MNYEDTNEYLTPEEILQIAREYSNLNASLDKRLNAAARQLKIQAAVVKKRQHATAETIVDNYNRIYNNNEQEFEYLSFGGTKPLSEIVQMIFGKRGYLELQNSINRISSSIEETCILANARVETSKGVFEYSEGCLPILLHFLWRKHQDKLCVRNLLNTFDFS